MSIETVNINVNSLNPPIISFLSNYNSILPEIEEIQEEIKIDLSAPEITKEAQILLDENKILEEITKIAVSEIDKHLIENKIDYKIDISMFFDKEVGNWAEFLISVKVNEKSSKERMKIWSLIEEKFDKKIKKIKQKYKKEIDQIKELERNLVIRFQVF